MTDIFAHSYTRERQRGDHFTLGWTQPLVVRHPARPFVVGTAPAHHARPRATARRHAGLGLLPVWLGLFALLNAGDLITTFIGLRGGLHEGNPLMGGLLAHFGFGALIAYKALVVVAVALGIVLLRRYHRGIANTTIWVCNALVLVVVILNALQYAVR